MFENHLGLRENPFVAGHQPRFVYPSREHQEALAHLRFGIENREPFVLITGEVGTGKTTAIYDALQGWGSKAVVALITNSALTRAELLEEIALRFGLALPPGMSKPQALVLLERHLLAIRERGDLAILLLDEAQNLERDLLEEIRLLSNLEAGGQKQMQIFLVGQPELEQKLARPELRQLRQRITVHYRLNPLSPDETARYIHHRVAVAGGNALDLFQHETCAAVYTLTHGIPREINTVCGQALINAYVDDSQIVKPEHVMTLARDTTFKSVLDMPHPGGPPAVDALLAAEAATVGPRPYIPPPVVAPPKPSAQRPPTLVSQPPAAEPEPELESEPVMEAQPQAFGDEPAGPPMLEREPVMEVPVEAMPDESSDFVPVGDFSADRGSPIVEPEPKGLRTAETPSGPPSTRPPVFSMEPDPPAEEAFDEPAPPKPVASPKLSTPWYGSGSVSLPATPEPESGSAPEPEHRSEAAPLSAQAPIPPSTPEPEPTSAAATSDEAPTEEVTMPAWLDEVIERKRAAEARSQPAKPEVVSASLPAPHIAPPPPPPIPPRVIAPAIPPRPAPMPAPVEAHSEYISARLREKLDEAEARKRGANPTPWFVAAVLLAAVAVALILMLRFGAAMPWEKKSAARPSVTPVATAPDAQPATDSTASEPPSPPPANRSAAQTSARRAEPLPAAPGTQAGSEPAPVAATEPAPKPASKPASAAPKTPKPKKTYAYAIVIGTYFDEARAADVATKAAAPLGLPTRTIAVVEDGAPMYEAVIGHFEDRTHAESAATKLASVSKVGEARVIALAVPPK